MKYIFSKFSIAVVLSFMTSPLISQTTSQTILGLPTAEHFQSKVGGKFYIQLGVFSKKENANRLEKSVRLKTTYPTHVQHKKGRYIITLGPLPSAAEVRAVSRAIGPLRGGHSRKIQSVRAARPKPIKTRQTQANSRSWSVTASLGYTNYQNMNQATGQTMLGRLAFGKEFFSRGPLGFGLELGGQNGNSMQLSASPAQLETLGSLPIQSTVKPIFDVLATVRTAPLGASSLFGQLKGGVAYRRWQFEDRDSINNLSQLAGEIQAGLGFPLSERTNLSLLYQGIFGGNPKFSVNTVNETGHVDSIPIQQGLLLSLSLIV